MKRLDPIFSDRRSGEIVNAVDKVQDIENIDELVELLIVPHAKRLTAVTGGKS